MPRHRLLWLYLRERTDLFDGRPKRLLHIGPAKRVSELLSHASALEYVSGDIDPEAARAMLRVDVTDIPFPSDHFDVVLCCHVLEHVHDDRKAMREVFRVLKPGGWAVLQVPLSKRERTLEDASVQSPAERERLYGKKEHVRSYGQDYGERLQHAGFSVTVDLYGPGLADQAADRLGLPGDRSVYVCSKPKCR